MVSFGILLPSGSSGPETHTCTINFVIWYIKNHREGGGGKGSYMYMCMQNHIFSLSLAAVGPTEGLGPEPLGSPLLDGGWSTSVGASDETTSVMGMEMIG